jgi:hypothetical protein
VPSFELQVLFPSSAACVSQLAFAYFLCTKCLRGFFAEIFPRLCKIYLRVESLKTTTTYIHLSSSANYDKYFGVYILLKIEFKESLTRSGWVIKRKGTLPDQRPELSVQVLPDLWRVGWIPAHPWGANTQGITYTHSKLFSSFYCNLFSVCLCTFQRCTQS